MSTPSALSQAAVKLEALAPGAVPFATLEIAERRWDGRHLCAVSSTEIFALSEKGRAAPIRLAFADIDAAFAEHVSIRVGYRVVVSSTTGTLSFGGAAAHVRQLACTLQDAGVTVAGLEESELMQAASTGPDLVGARQRRAERHPVLVVTTPGVPGREIVEVFGLVTGATVRARNLISDLGAEVKSVFGGELNGATKMVEAARQEAQERLEAAARTRGANAVVGVHFDTESLGSGASQSSAVVAYGTAVRVTPLPTAERTPEGAGATGPSTTG